MKVRLNKRLAQLGVASRREADRLIEAGRVSVNGTEVHELGVTVEPADQIALDGRPLEPLRETCLVVIYKPGAVVCTRRDPEGRETIYNLLPPELPVLAHVGRLDYHTEGLLLLTNDGDLAERLLHPDSRIARTYEVKARGSLSREQWKRLEEGVALDDRPTLAVELERMPSEGKHTWLRMTLFEGKNRHIRRILEAVGSDVLKLRRVGFGPLTLEGLRIGGWRLCTPGEIASLRSLAG
jgi:23S rRNA pseudouridine2605 synthase